MTKYLRGNKVSLYSEYPRDLRGAVPTLHMYLTNLRSPPAARFSLELAFRLHVQHVHACARRASFSPLASVEDKGTRLCVQKSRNQKHRLAHATTEPETGRLPEAFAGQSPSPPAIRRSAPRKTPQQAGLLPKLSVPRPAIPARAALVLLDA